LLHTGHCIIDTEKGKEIADRVTTKVTFAKMSDAEIADYVAFWRTFTGCWRFYV
jgi:septum formation protein